MVLASIIIPLPAGYWHRFHQPVDGCQSFLEPDLSALLYNQTTLKEKDHLIMYTKVVSKNRNIK